MYVVASEKSVQSVVIPFVVFFCVAVCRLFRHTVTFYSFLLLLLILCYLLAFTVAHLRVRFVRLHCVLRQQSEFAFGSFGSFLPLRSLYSALQSLS